MTEMIEAPLKIPLEELDAYQTDTTVKEEEGTKTRKRTARIRQKSKKVTKKPTALFHKFERNGDDILLPLGGGYGIIMRDFNKAIEAMGKSGYKYFNAIDLIQVFPEKVNVGKKKVEKDFFLVPRNTRGNKATRVLEGFEVLKDIQVEFKLRINSECPLTEEEIVGLFHALEGLKGFGPAGRGKIEVTNID
jgi:hypothetical protein